MKDIIKYIKTIVISQKLEVVLWKFFGIIIKQRTSNKQLATSYRTSTPFSYPTTNNKQLTTKTLITCYLILFTITSFAQQQYPVQVNQTFVPPYDSKLNSYATSTSVKMRLYLTMTDINISNRQVRLKLKFEGQGISAESTDFVTGASSVFLTGGTQQQFTNIDLAPYFQQENLVGINTQQYNQSLPEGSYTFCWEVYDYLTNQLISNPNLGCTDVYITLNDPPFLNMPQDGDQIVKTDPTNIIFQWTPRHVNATNVSYDFELRELWDTGIDPEVGFFASPNFYTENTYSTTLLYNISKPTLLPGKKYAWRVRAKSLSGLDENAVFDNDGYSEVYYFTYTNSCDAPTFLLAEPKGTSQVNISWQLNPDHKRYHVQYKRTDVDDAEWFEVYSFNNQVQIANLQDGVTYDFRVGGTCDELTNPNQGFSYTAVNQFTMPSEDESVTYSCGIVPEIEITNTELLGSISMNESFTAGDFPVTVKQIQNTNGSYTGKGYIVVPYLADTKIAVEFSNIQINTDYQLINGVIKTTYDPTWGDMADVGDMMNGGVAHSNTNEVDFPIAEVVIDPNGDILIVGEGGSPVVELPGGEDYTITYAGDPGADPPIPSQTWHVDENGNVTEGGEQAEGGASTAENTNGVDSNGEANNISAEGVTVTFTKANDNIYGFDAYDNRYSNTESLYKKLGDNYYMPYKGIAKNNEDSILANISITNDTIKPHHIIFKTTDGTALTKIDSTATSYTLKLTGVFDDAAIETQAVIKQGDKYEIAGAFIQYQIATKDVEVVLVNTITGLSTSNLERDIKEIYQQAMVNLNISTINDFTDDLNALTPNGTITSGESGFAAQYTDQQRSINAVLRGRSDYKENAYYLILTNKTPTTSDEKGLMPLGRQFGYIYETTAKTVAHELGHGAFQLKHPFSSLSHGWQQGSTDWLLDYGSNATHIPYEQWTAIHNPTLRIGIFDSDEEGEDRVNDGIDLLGNIISRVEYDETILKIVGKTSATYPYLRAGYKVYSLGNDELIGTYNAEIDGTTVKYVTETGQMFPYSIQTTTSGVAKIKISRDQCSYNSAEIQWVKESFSSTQAVINKVVEEIDKQNPTWKLYSYYKPDPSCSAVNKLADILSLDSSSECSDTIKVQEGTQNIIAVFDNDDATQDELVSIINTNCLSSLRNVSYSYIIDVFEKLASSASITEDKEIAILRLMTVIQSENYDDLLTVMKDENNKIYLNLIDRVHDSSINWFDGENLSTFIDVLLFINYHSNSVNERTYLLNLLMNYDYTNFDITSEILSKVFNNEIKDSEKQAYFDSLKVNNYELYKLYLSKLNKQYVGDDILYIEESSKTLSELVASKGNSSDVISLSDTIIEEMNSLDQSYKEENDNNSNSLFYIKKAALISSLIQSLPSDKQNLYTTYKSNNFEKFIYYSTHVNTEDKYLANYINGFSKLIDEVGVVADKITLVNWAIDNDGVIDNLDILLAEILDNISDPDDKENVYQALSKDDHKLFKDCVEVLGGSSSYLFSFTETYSKLISEAASGSYLDRIDIIEHAISEGDDWAFFWYSDTEDVISAMFSHMSSSQARDFINEFKKDNYNLFFEIWDVLKVQTWWQAIDGDNKRFENFVTSLGKNFILANEVAENNFPESLIQYKDETQNYLNSKTGDIAVIEGNYVPMTRASLFDGTNGQNDYELEAVVKSKKINVKIDIEDIDGTHKFIIDRDFDPFEYVFIELLEDVEVNDTLTYNKGDILGIPAFYLAWMDGYIDSQQLSVAIRVGVDAVVVVASAAAAVGTGGASLALLGAEIIFATTDATIALKGDEMKQAFGEDFVEGLEMANLIWGIANLPSAVVNLPKGLAKIKTSAGSILESGTDAFKTFVNNVQDLNSVEISLHIDKIADAVKAFSKIDRTAYINKLGEQIAAIQIKYDNLIAGGITPSEKITNFYKNSLKAASDFYLENAGSLFATSINSIPFTNIQRSITNKLLHLQFDGQTFCKISPEGIISELKIFDRVENYTELAGEFTATLSANGKTYTKNISVIKDYNGKPYFRAKFDTSVKHDGDLINAVYARNGDLPPYATGTENVSDVILQPGVDKVYIVEYLDQTVPGGFGSNEAITSIEELRNKLAVLKGWKNTDDGKLVLREYEVRQPLEARSGPIGPQTEVDGTVYPGGGHQYEFMDNWYNLGADNVKDNYLKLINTTELINSTSDWVNSSLLAKLDDLGDILLKQKFLDDFANASNETKVLLNNNPSAVNIWKAHTSQGQLYLVENADIWLKHIKSRSFLKSGNYDGVIDLFGGTKVSSFDQDGFKYLYDLDQVPDTRALSDAVAIANRSDDVAQIADKMGYSSTIIEKVKDHFFIKNHLHYTESGFQIGRFERSAEDIAVWNGAMNDGLTSDISFKNYYGAGENDFVNGVMTATEAKNYFISLMKHEYVELRLMEEGLSFRSLGNPNVFTPSDFGAHDLAPTFNGNVLDNLKISETAPIILDDLSNVEEYISFYKRILNL